MHKINKDDAEKLGFHLDRRRSRGVGPVLITDLDFVDDLAQVTKAIGQVEEVLERLEAEAAKVGLHLNVTKIKTSLEIHTQKRVQNQIL